MGTPSGMSTSSLVDVSCTEEDRQAARLHVCSAATDAADARIILDRLGLLDDE